MCIRDRDISERVLSILNGGQNGKVVTDEPVVIVADDLAPSETVQLEKDMAVSYTHLDVYKRQIRKCLGLREWTITVRLRNFRL